MNRRQFLITSTAASFVRRAEAAQTWSLVHESQHYVVALSGATLVVTCGDASSIPPDAPMISVGAGRRPVTWRVSTAHQPDARTLRIALNADEHPLIASITFAVDEATGLLSRTTVLRHRGIGADVDVTATVAGCYRIAEPIARVLYLAGEWAHETQPRRGQGDQPLLLESRTGKTGFAYQPYVALRTDAATYLCEVFWSGNWSLRVMPDADGVTLLGGFNDWRFRHRLGPTGSLELPTMLFGRCDGDLNVATHRLHDWRRARRPDPDRSIPVQFNSWYQYFGEPTAEAMLALVPVAKRLGCEAFVVDAGWYRTDEGDTASEWEMRTGDWHTSRKRFPNGLREVSEACRTYDLSFGLWFEPEVIGPLSAVRREHPEWLHHIDGRAPAANQRAVLNLGVPAARQHAFERVTRILSTVGVEWMKWDFNADLGAGGWAPGLPYVLTDQDPLVAHYDGLYRMQDAVRRWFPDLLLEMCASGGGRMDGAILSHAHVNWISDQPGPLRKLAIHFGSQLAHPAVVCNDWLIEWPPGGIAGYDEGEAAGVDERGDLEFRLRVAMLGSFGISARADNWPKADFAVAVEHVALYRDTLRPIIHAGDQYLLTPAPPVDGGDWAAIWYAAKDGRRGVLFAFRLEGADAARNFPLPGLLPRVRYRVRRGGGETAEATGEALAGGLTVMLSDRYRSELCVVEAL